LRGKLHKLEGTIELELGGGGQVKVEGPSSLRFNSLAKEIEEGFG